MISFMGGFLLNFLFRCICFLCEDSPLIILDCEVWGKIEVLQ